MRLLLCLYLQTMLHAAEKPVSVVEGQHFIAWKNIQLTKRSQRFEHVRLLQERLTRSMNKLKRLHDEFDFPNAAAPKFYVAFQLVRSHHGAFDAPLDTGDLIQQIGRHAPGVNKRLMLPQKLVSQLTATADSARFD